MMRIVLLGLLLISASGCIRHRTQIPISNNNKPVIIETTCVLVFTIAGIPGGLYWLVNDYAQGSLFTLATGALIDWARCGAPPRAFLKVKEYKPRKVEEYKGYKRNKYKARPAATCGKRKNWSYRLHKCVRK